MIQEGISYVTSNIIELIILLLLAILVNIIWEVLKTISKPLNDFVLRIKKRIVLFFKNPVVPTEITLSGSIRATSQHDFELNVKRELQRVLNRSVNTENGIFKFPYAFGVFSVEIEIIPSTIPDSPEHLTDSINDVSIIVRSDNIRIRNLKEGILTTHGFVFKNLVDILRPGLRFSPDVNNENLVVKFKTPPSMVNKIRDSRIRELRIQENTFNVLINHDKIDLTGNIEEPIVDQFVNLIKINLFC